VFLARCSRAFADSHACTASDTAFVHSQSGDLSMPTTPDNPTTPRATAGFLSTLRDVLFEAAPNGPVEGSAVTANVAAATDCDIEPARAALRQSLEETLGPGAREFALQVEALREVLPEAKQRQRAALRVLSLKGIAPQTLVAELEQAITRLSQQRDAFASKLSARQGVIEQQRRDAIEACRVETAETEQAIDRLQRELETARAQLTETGARCLQMLGECDAHAARLTQKQRSFERAFTDLHGEYATLQRQLSNPESV
jgi:hypothetical protein